MLFTILNTAAYYTENVVENCDGRLDSPKDTGDDPGCLQ